MAWRTSAGTARLAAAVLGLVALVARFLYGLGFSGFASVDYIAYLTTQSNIALVVVNATAGILLVRGRAESSRFSAIRAAVTSYVIVAGIVFGILASQAPAQGYRLDVPWSDQVLHFYLPTIALLDWLILPGRQRVHWRVLAWVVGYPVGWGVITLIRGPFVGWYPYFFLDPAQAGYPVPFLAYSACALALFAAVGAGLVAATRTLPLAELDLRRPVLDRRTGGWRPLSRRTGRDFPRPRR